MPVKLDYPITERQYWIAKLLSTGLRIQEIADKIFLSYTTVEREITALKQNLGVKTQAGIVGKVLRELPEGVVVSGKATDHLEAAALELEKEINKCVYPEDKLKLRSIRDRVLELTKILKGEFPYVRSRWHGKKGT